jgi:hemoglobin
MPAANMGDTRKTPGASTAYDALGGRDAVLGLSEAFYDAMELLEPELTALHRLDEQGRVHRDARDRFAQFLVGFLGGPQDYVREHGHPRLRMRHAHVAVDERMRDAWLHSMRVALDGRGIDGPVRELLDRRFAELADFMRNQPG